MRHRNVHWLLAAFTLALGLIQPAPSAAQQVSGEEVRQAIARAVAWLQEAQGGNGRWREMHQEGDTTALVTLALLNAGVSQQNAEMRQALEAVRAIPLQHTYTVSLKVQVLAAADPKRYQNEIRAAADWLTRAQQPNGMWGYGLAGGSTDFSNSQFALLGLHEASKAGAPIPAGVWRAAEKAWIDSQQADGGWGYQPAARASGSMTTAGVASLYIVGHSLTARKRPGVGSDGRIICCGQYSESKPIARGLNWLARNFDVRRNPRGGMWYYYYMYGLERVGIISGRRHIGDHDWYREGAAELVRRQQPDGSWQEMNPIVDTAFGLLFLAKGHKPLLFHKLQWSQDGRWNLTRDDLNHLISFIADRLGEPPAWEAVSTADPVERWLAAPILYFNGDDFPSFTRNDIEKLQEYVKQGGTILAVASCNGERFRQGFAALAKSAFPDHALHRLPPEHPVFRMLFQVDPGAIELYGMDVGCRTSVFYCPRDLACLWEFPSTPQSKAALELGTNLAAYATGLEPLPDKLDVVRLTRPATPEAGPAPRGALAIAQLMHNGDWRPDPQVIPRLAQYLHDKMGVDVVPRAEPLEATDPRLVEHPIVLMTGHFSFELTPEEVAALRRHLDRGGFLFAEACCGRRAFDVSFRKLASQLFPDRPLAPLPPTHPIIAGSPGVPLPSVAYRPAVQAEFPGMKAVRLEGVDREGRTVLVFSPFSVGCGVDGHSCFACRGLADADAIRLAGNVVLYALSY